MLPQHLYVCPLMMFAKMAKMTEIPNLGDFGGSSFPKKRFKMPQVAFFVVGDDSCHGKY